MKIQVAIDRVTTERAIEIISMVKDSADIIEIGTSLIKDYGLESLRRIRNTFPDIKLLADIKTIDEAEYEFKAAYKAGADILTVMGAASVETIKICQDMAAKYKKEYMIDLLEVSFDKISELKQFQDAYFCIHLPVDNNGAVLEKLIEKSSRELIGYPKLAAAGGVSLKTIPILKEKGFEIAIVGSAIIKSENIKETASAFSREAR
ncbi:MAG: 3-hexulose-6-phosphate synthase [Lachnoclostridium sp.]